MTLLNHDLFTNDILYMEVALDMRPLPTDLLPLMPLFCRSVFPLHPALQLITCSSMMCCQQLCCLRCNVLPQSCAGDKPCVYSTAPGTYAGVELRSWGQVIPKATVRCLPCSLSS